MLLDKEAQLTQNSYYEASVIRPAPSAPLLGRVSADICVVGAGLAGLSAALELRAKGYTVAVLEAKTTGWGASGRNGGQAIVGYASDEAIESQFAPEDCRRAWAITVEALQLIRQRILDHQIECDFVPGYMSMAVNEKKGRELAQATVDIQKRYGYEMQAIAAPE